MTPQTELIWRDGEVVSMRERIIVSPCEGRFHSEPPHHYTTEGEYVLDGQLVGNVAGTNGEVVPVYSPGSGWVMDFFVRDGTPVRAGQRIFSLVPL